MDDLKDFVKHGLRRHALTESLVEGKSETQAWWERLPGKRRKKVVDVLGLSKGKDKTAFGKMDPGEQSEIEAYFAKYKGRVEGFDAGTEPLGPMDFSVGDRVTLGKDGTFVVKGVWKSQILIGKPGKDSKQTKLLWDRRAGGEGKYVHEIGFAKHKFYAARDVIVRRGRVEGFEDDGDVIEEGADPGLKKAILDVDLANRRLGKFVKSFSREKVGSPEGLRDIKGKFKRYNEAFSDFVDSLGGSYM